MLISVHKYVLLEKCQSCGQARQKYLIIFYDYFVDLFVPCDKAESRAYMVQKEENKIKKGIWACFFQPHLFT